MMITNKVYFTWRLIKKFVNAQNFCSSSSEHLQPVKRVKQVFTATILPVATSPELL